MTDAVIVSPEAQAIEDSAPKPGSILIYPDSRSYAVTASGSLLRVVKVEDAYYRIVKTSKAERKLAKRLRRRGMGYTR